MDAFTAGENTWTERLGNLRNTVRQEPIGRHLDDHVQDGAAVVDIGCGQGTQAIRLARRGCSVTGVDPSAHLLARCAADVDVAGVAVEMRQGHLEDLDAVLGDRTFEVVCAHGVLMYLDDPMLALDRLSDRVAPGGLLSVTFRNGDALAFRPGIRGQWQAAVEAMNATTYVNELGVRARADRLEDVTEHLEGRGMSIEAWYGVRVFTDARPGEEGAVTGPDLEWLLRAEQQACARDPYRRLASQLHVLARQPDHG